MDLSRFPNQVGELQAEGACSRAEISPLSSSLGNTVPQEIHMVVVVHKILFCTENAAQVQGQDRCSAHRARATAILPSALMISRPSSTCLLASTLLARVTLVMSGKASRSSAAREGSLVTSWRRCSSVPRERLDSLL